MYNLISFKKCIFLSSSIFFSTALIGQTNPVINALDSLLGVGETEVSDGLDWNNSIELDSVHLNYLASDSANVDSIAKKAFVPKVVISKAEELYNRKAYKESIEAFREQGDLSLKDKTKIADSYRMIHDTKNAEIWYCLLYTSPSPRDLSTSRMPSSA